MRQGVLPCSFTGLPCLPASQYSPLADLGETQHACGNDFAGTGRLVGQLLYCECGQEVLQLWAASRSCCHDPAGILQHGRLSAAAASSSEPSEAWWQDVACAAVPWRALDR